MTMSRALSRGLHALYAATIDRSKFREIASRVAVFVVPLFFWGRPPWWWGMGFVAAGVLIRAWAAGYLRKDEVAAAEGPYLLVRHPLYFGSCLLALGFVVTLHHWVVTILIGGTTTLIYWHTISHEEKNLVLRFGDSYRRYQKVVGPLWPKPKGLWLFFKSTFSGNKGQKFSFRQYLKNREYECFLGVLIIVMYLYLGAHWRL